MCHNVLRFSFIMSGNVSLSMQCVFAANCIAVVVHNGVSFRAALIFVSGIYRVLLLPPSAPLVDRGYFASWRFNRRFCERCNAPCFFLSFFFFYNGFPIRRERQREKKERRGKTERAELFSFPAVCSSCFLSQRYVFIERNLKFKTRPQGGKIISRSYVFNY